MRAVGNTRYTSSGRRAWRPGRTPTAVTAVASMTSMAESKRNKQMMAFHNKYNSE